MKPCIIRDFVLAAIVFVLAALATLDSRNQGRLQDLSVDTAKLACRQTELIEWQNARLGSQEVSLQKAWQELASLQDSLCKMEHRVSALERPTPAWPSPWPNFPPLTNGWSFTNGWSWPPSVSNYWVEPGIIYVSATSESRYAGEVEE